MGAAVREHAEAVKSEIATFFEVFPNGTIWANNINGRGYDIVLLGQVEPTKIDVKQVIEAIGSAGLRSRPCSP